MIVCAGASGIRVIPDGGKRLIALLSAEPL
jgi:hypothetical protein